MTVTTTSIASLEIRSSTLLPNKINRLPLEIFREVAIQVVALFYKFPSASFVVVIIVLLW